jgi:hypothetical protein
MIPYTLYTALVLASCFAFYKLLLQKETFFGLNRFMLIACMALAFILPLLPVPQQLSFRKAPVVEAPDYVQQAVYVPPGYTSQQENNYLAAVEPAEKTQGITVEKITTLLVYVYWFGVILFALNFLMQVFILLRKAYTRPVIKDGKFRIVEIDDDKAPCSFGNNIFINPAKYDFETYTQVLLHEKIHIEQKHTLDLLIAEIVLIFQWFNPFAWQLRKALENNLEFLTDNSLLQHDAVEKKTYQVSLLKVAAPYYPLSLTTNYNQSLIKKRLIMMNAKKSNVHTIWKYFFLLPLMTAFVCLLNEPVANSQAPNQKQTANIKNKNEHHDFKTTGSWFATIKGDKINMQFRNDNDENSYNGNTFSLNEFSSLPKDAPGTFTLTREAGTMEFTGKFDGDKGMGNYKFTPNKIYGDNMRKEGIEVANDEDMMVFFFVNVKLSYVQMLKQNGYTNLDKDDIIPLAALGIDEAYIKSIKAAGFKDISTEDLIPFKSLGIDQAYIEDIRKAGYTNISPDKIIAFKAQGIDGKFIKDYRSSFAEPKQNSASNNNSSSSNSQNSSGNANQHNNKNGNDNNDDEDDIVSFKALGITDEYTQSIKNAGYPGISSDDLVSMKALGVTPEYIKSFKDAGYTNVSADDIISAKAQGIAASSISEYKTLGVGDMDMDDVISAKATGTTPALIKEYQALGFKDLSLDDIVGAKATGTTPAIVKEYQALGFKDLSLEDIIGAKATGTTPALIKQYQALGFKELSLENIVGAKSTGTTPAIIKQYKALGFAKLDIEDCVGAVATGTTPAFINSMKQKGHNLKSLEDYVSLKAVLN